MPFNKHVIPATVGALLLTSSAFAYDDVPGALPGDRHYSPYPEQNYPNRVFFGDTHCHTSYSADAGMIGNRLGPEEAYRFAKGETVTSSTGLPARLARPTANSTLFPTRCATRRRRRPAGTAVEALVANGEGPEAALEALQRDRALERALAELREEQRQIIVLRDYLDLAYADIAAVLDIAPGTVMSRLHRARLALRERLEQTNEQ